MNELTSDEFMDVFEEYIHTLDDDQVERVSFLADATMFDRGMIQQDLDEENE